MCYECQLLGICSIAHTHHLPCHLSLPCGCVWNSVFITTLWVCLEQCIYHYPVGVFGTVYLSLPCGCVWNSVFNTTLWVCLEQYLSLPCGCVWNSVFTTTSCWLSSVIAALPLRVEISIIGSQDVAFPWQFSHQFVKKCGRGQGL